jgi:hypothetical protein
MKTQLSADVLRNRDQLCTAEHSPQALLPKVHPGLNLKADRLHWRRLNIRQGSEKLWAAA